MLPILRGGLWDLIFIPLDYNPDAFSYFRHHSCF